MVVCAFLYEDRALNQHPILKIRPHKIKCLFQVQFFFKLHSRKQKINKTVERIWDEEKKFIDMLTGRWAHINVKLLHFFSATIILKIECAR